jgi:phosphoglycolate phosphatase
MSRAVLFDLDGTLVDSRADLAHSVNAALAEVGLAQRSIAEITGFIGEGSRRLIEKAVGPREDLLEAAHQAWERAYAENLLVRTVLYPGVAELLERLAQRVPGRLAVHTNKPGRYARPILEGLGLAGRFARVLGGNDGAERKPSPAGARRLISELSADVATSTYVGDSAIDAATAASAGLGFIGVSWGYGGEQQLREAGATAIARDAADLGELLRL